MFDQCHHAAGHEPGRANGLARPCDLDDLDHSPSRRHFDPTSRTGSNDLIRSRTVLRRHDNFYAIALHASVPPIHLSLYGSSEESSWSASAYSPDPVSGSGGNACPIGSQPSPVAAASIKASSASSNPSATPSPASTRGRWAGSSCSSPA